jgi:hypothetical protein
MGQMVKRIDPSRLDCGAGILGKYDVVHLVVKVLAKNTALEAPEQRDFRTLGHQAGNVPDYRRARCSVAARSWLFEIRGSPRGARTFR